MMLLLGKDGVDLDSKNRKMHSDQLSLLLVSRLLALTFHAATPAQLPAMAKFLMPLSSSLTIDISRDLELPVALSSRTNVEVQMFDWLTGAAPAYGANQIKRRQSLTTSVQKKVIAWSKC
jgi:hypothetical protein